ncbi:MAG: hypothetical protein MUE85_07705 [Microscillaceae bacterium]|jgi:hypothetical protein|nr:hypothetical protein [Microscillaceae bacterium]
MNFNFFALSGSMLFLTLNLSFAQNTQVVASQSSETNRVAPTYYFVNDALTNENQVKKILKNPERWVRKVKIMTQSRFAKTYKLKLDGNALMIYTKGKDWELQSAP